jgi:tetratricopeptide (TPR) repeat protein
MSLRNSLAKSLIEQHGNQFERAEMLLQDNIEAAERTGKSDLIVRAKVALATARGERGMYEEAVGDFRSIMKNLPEDLDVSEKIRLRNELAHVLMECGDAEVSEQVIQAAAEDVESTEGVRAIASKAALAFGIASVFAFEDQDKARAALEECYSHLESLPPGLEVIPSSHLRHLALMLDQSADDADERWETHAEQTSREHQRKFGQARPTLEAQFTVSRAMHLIENGEVEQGRTLLEKVKENLESRDHNTGMLYAAVLGLLADHLDPGDPRASEYEDRANKIRSSAERAIEVWKGGDPDED